MLRFSPKITTNLFHKKANKKHDKAPTEKMKYITLTLFNLFGSDNLITRNINGPI